jgi:hypothetical protein
VALAGCGGGGSSSDASDSSSAGGGTVQGVALTDQGTALTLGKAATVSWQPDQHRVGVIKVAVDGLEKVPPSQFRDWRLDAATQKSTPYFVRAAVENVGTTDLSGVRVPLYLLDGRDTLLQPSTFRASFPACPSTPLPARFTAGAKASVCLVYFAPDHGTLTAISFRPTEDFDAITWAGPVTEPTPRT